MIDFSLPVAMILGISFVVALLIGLWLSIKPLVDDLISSILDILQVEE